MFSKVGSPSGGSSQEADCFLSPGADFHNLGEKVGGGVPCRTPFPQNSAPQLNPRSIDINKISAGEQLMDFRLVCRLVRHSHIQVSKMERPGLIESLFKTVQKLGPGQSMDPNPHKVHLSFRIRNIPSHGTWDHSREIEREGKGIRGSMNSEIWVEITLFLKYSIVQRVG